MNKNNMDKVFREKFRDFTEIPDEKVWRSISNSLDKKKKSRRMVPLWWKLAGAAALIAILFLLVDPLAEPAGSDMNITDRNQPAIPAVKDASANKNDDSKNRGIEEALSSSESAEKTTPVDNEARVNEVPNTAASKTELLESADSHSKGAESKITENGESVRAGAREGKKDDPINSAANRQGIAQIEKKGAGKEVMTPEVSVKSGTDPAHAANTGDRIAQADITQKDKEEDAAAGKKSIFDEISEDNEEMVAASEGDKWSLGARVAPVYFNSIGTGSPIHPNFVSNPKSGNVNFSYGLSVSYEVTPKLSVRSGVHKVDYGYDTNDILFTSSLAASTQVQLTNIDYALASKNLVVQSLSDNQGTPDLIANNTKEVAGPEPSQTGRMVQQFGYLEVPLELNYALLESKLGIKLIGGVSSLFLVDNSVTLQSNSGETQIGEANNINSLNFSTNVGFGVNYQLSQKIQLSVEPMFKYQLNTFSDSSGDFQPFSVGVYSGLNFKF